MEAPTTSPNRNPLTTYLRLLHRTKSSLPHGQLVCVSASPNISTMAALLRLACAVGPYIAVLQVHADIIDDWSLDGVRKLTNVAKRFGFLIWEGGRILNTKRRPTGQHPLSSHEVARDIAMARKRYTKGISVAAWAALASTWAIEPEEQGKGGIQLIPALRWAARETVSRMTTSVHTEISGGTTGAGLDDHRDELYGDEDEEQESDLFDESAIKEIATSQPPRKGSVISLTRTITQHAELSNLPLIDPDEDCGCDVDEEDETLSINSLPPPPLLSRSVVICLPNNPEAQSTSQQRKIAIASAKANKDFVMGFVTEEPWVNVQRDQSLADSLQRSEDDDEDGAGEVESNPDDVEVYAVFSPLENSHVDCSTNAIEPRTKNGDSLSSPTSPLSSPRQAGLGTQAQQIRALHELVARASVFCSSQTINHIPSNSSNQKGLPQILHIPVINMNV